MNNNGKISPSILNDAINLSFQNSQQYLNDALRLERICSYGHALSLSILGIEELGKAVGYYHILIHQEIPLQGRISFDLITLFKDLQSNHHTKLSIYKFFSYIRDLNMRNIMELRKKLDKEGEIIVYKSKRGKIQIKKPNDIHRESINKYIKSMENIKDIDKKKQYGLYVSIDIKKSKVISPNDISKEECKKYIELLSLGLDEFSYIIDE